MTRHYHLKKRSRAGDMLPYCTERGDTYCSFNHEDALIFEGKGEAREHRACQTESRRYEIEKHKE